MGNTESKHSLEMCANDQEFGEEEDKLDDSDLPVLSGTIHCQEFIGGLLKSLKST